MAADAEQTGGNKSKAKIFISYSRKDMAFVDRIEPALKARGFEPLIDREEIYAFEKWWERLQVLIGQADTIVFVLSPDAVASREALREVEYAASLNKRFAPIVCRRVEDSAIPEALRRLNFIFFDDPDKFDTSLTRLTEALQTDIEWIRRHTQFGEFAQRWHAAGRPGPSGLMLRPPLLTDAEAWLDLRPLAAPEPTQVLRAFIAESRDAFDQEQAAIVTSQANLLAEVGDAQRLRGNLVTGLKLCVHAVRRQLETQRRAGNSSRPSAALALAVCQSNWRLMLGGHQDAVPFAAFSSDGKRVVTASQDKTARIWDSATGEEIAVLRGHQRIAPSEIVSPDGSLIVKSSPEWDLSILEAEAVGDIAFLRELLTEGYPVLRVAFTPNGERIVTASSNDKIARIWEVTTGKEVAVLCGHEYGVSSAAFSPDGSRIVTASYDLTARIWDAATAKQIDVLEGHESFVTNAFFSPDGSRILTVSYGEGVRIWDAATGKETVFLGGVWFARFCPDGTRIVAIRSLEKSPRILEAATGKEIATLFGHDGDVTSAAFDSDGLRIVTTSADKTARIWDGAGNALAVFWHESVVSSAAFSPDDMRVVTTFDNTARIWDAEWPTIGRQIAILFGHEDTVTSAAFSSDGTRIVTSSSDRTARIWDATAAKEIEVRQGQQGIVDCAAFSPDGKHIVTAVQGTVCIWDAATGEEIMVMPGNRRAVHSAAYSSDGKRIVTASDDNTGRIWDVATGRQIAVLSGHQGAVVSASFNRDGTRIVTASQDNTARIWNAATARKIAVLQGHDGLVWSAVFNPDGRCIVTVSADKTARIWDVATGKQIAVLVGHADDVRSAAFSPDGSQIVTASHDKTARIWDAATAKEIAVLRGHEHFVRFASFSADGSRIVTASYEETVRIWDAATGKEIASLRGNGREVTSAAFSPDGSQILTASESVRVWDSRFATMSPNNLVIETCTRRLRGLTKLSRDEMRLAGYPDDMPEIDVGAGVE